MVTTWKTDLVLLNEILSDKFCVQKKRICHLHCQKHLFRATEKIYCQKFLSVLGRQYMLGDKSELTLGKTCLISPFLSFMLKINAQFLTVVLVIHNKKRHFWGKPSLFLHLFYIILNHKVDIFVHQDK